MEDSPPTEGATSKKVLFDSYNTGSLLPQGTKYILAFTA